MKRISLILLTGLLLFLLCGCVTSSKPDVDKELLKNDTITIFSLNDVHGNAYASDDALSRFGYFYKNFNKNHKMSITNGDMLQGSAFSNVFYGEPIIKTLNLLHCDAFNIGNHEFDWGIDKITDLANTYSKPNKTKLDCPILAANIFSKKDNLPLPNTKPYIVKNLGNTKIGVIGLIGKIENSIEYSKVKDYYFSSPVEAAKKYARILRSKEGCQGVIITIHDGAEKYNHELSKLSGNEEINAIFNGHTHKKEYELLNNTLPTIQCYPGDNSYFCSLSFKLENNKLKFITGSEKHYDTRNLPLDKDCEDIRNDFLKRPEYDKYNKLLTTLVSPINKYQMLNLVVRHIGKLYSAHVAVFNNGGIRIQKLEGAIRGLDIYKAFPFGNRIIICEVPGNILLDFYKNMRNVIYSPFDFNEIKSEQIYKVAGIDYVLNSNYNTNAIKRYRKNNPAALWQDAGVIYREEVIKLFNSHNPFDYNKVLNSLKA